MSKDIQTWKVKDLKPHPRQATFFADLPFHLLRDLAQDIADRGLKEPLEILPDGTIVCGHQRARAAELLEWDEIAVWVNHDLAAQGNLAVEQRLIEDNLARRNLDRLDQVRCYRRLVEMATETPDDKRRSHQLGRVRDVVGTRLGMSGRTLDRYLRILDAPREVQDAFKAGDLSLVAASKVAGLSAEIQAQIVAELRAGADAKRAVTPHLAGRVSDPLDAAFGPFIRSLERNVKALEGHVDQVRSLHPADIGILEDGKRMIDQLLRQVKGQHPAADNELTGNSRRPNKRPRARHK
jgi:ParB-like chromosome segregation protein Spo0J